MLGGRLSEEASPRHEKLSGSLLQETCAFILKSSHPELGPGLLQGLDGGVQGAPPVGQLRFSPLPALQKQSCPDDIEESKNYTADILAGLCGDKRLSQSLYATLIVKL